MVTAIITVSILFAILFFVLVLPKIQGNKQEASKRVAKKTKEMVNSKVS